MMTFFHYAYDACVIILLLGILWRGRKQEQMDIKEFNYLAQALAGIDQRLHKIEHSLGELLGKDIQIMGQLDDIQAAVQAVSDAVGVAVTAMDSGVSTLNDIAAKLAAAIAGGGATPAQLTAIQNLLAPLAGNLTTASSALTQAIATDDPPPPII